MTFTRIDPDDRDHWLELRRGLITASDAAAITGDSPWESFDDVVRKKVTGQATEVTQAMWFGTMREANNLTIFEAITRLECVLDGSLCVSDTYPYLGCTLDAYVNGLVGEDYWDLCESPVQLRDLPYELFHDGTPIELKNVQSKNRSLWNKDSVPRYYWCQKQAQLMVTEEPVGLLVAFVDACEVYAHVIHADPVYHAKLAQEAKRAVDAIRDLTF